MNELPPDPPRLRAILGYLENQLAEEETVLTYLRLQVETVRRALAVAENRKAADYGGPHAGHAQRPPPGGAATGGAATARPAPGPAPNGGERAPAGFMVEQRRTPAGPREAAVHLDDCTMTTYMTHPVSAREARLALTDAQLEACAFCRPDTELGILE